jgi:alanine racemase
LRAAPPGPARLTVDLGAVAENWRRLRGVAAPAEVAAVVKADAYGLGAARVAPALARAGCRAFFVARVAEGVELRRALPLDRRVLVLDGLAAGGAEACVEHGLVPVLNGPGDVERWRREVVLRRRRLPAALHVDTGMTRLGLSAADARTLAEEPRGGVDPVLVMSHLACAEVPDDPLNGVQLERFGRLAALFGGVPRSLANSSGIFLGPEYRFNLCRPGVALYGVNPTPGAANPMRPVVRLEAPVLQVHEVDAPGSVGYGATRATRPGERIATLPVGYADGFPRAAGAWAVRFGGAELPLAGRVSMDLMSVDATGAPALAPGSVVEVLGGPDGIDRLAEAAGTIGYEVLTRLGRRYERVYTGDDEDGTADA